MNKIGELQEKFLSGYFGEEFQCNITNSQEQIAAFIVKYDRKRKDIEIRDSNDHVLISGFGPYINDDFQQILTQIQNGEKQVEFKEPVISELFPEITLVSEVAIFEDFNWCKGTFIFENGKIDVYSIDSKNYDTKSQLLAIYPNLISIEDVGKIGLDKQLISKDTFLKHKLKYGFHDHWDLKESHVNLWISVFEEMVENTVVKDFETCIDIVEDFKYFHLYKDKYINSYSKLAKKLLGDHLDWDENNIQKRAYLDKNQDDETAMKNFLLKEGWYVSSKGRAFYLDNEDLTNKTKIYTQI